jgi:hypothetical protein
MKLKRNTFYCFSPPVMIATFAIEIALALYTIWRYRQSTAMRLAVALLGFLALFQLAEYFVCGGLGVNARGWSRVGYVAITMLPPLGLHLLHVVAGKSGRYLVRMAYVSAAAFMVYFLLDPGVFASHGCSGNYVIFRIGEQQAWAYSAYYFGWLVISIFLGFAWASWLVRQKTGRANQKFNAILGLIGGYMVFLVPTATVNAINPETTAGIPSIMCGFAVLFAILLVTYVLPNSAKTRH